MLNTTGIEVVVGGRRILTKNKGWETFTSFNAYIAVPHIGFGTLVTGFRISNGKILPPVKWNPTSKKFFNTAYTSGGLARALRDCIQETWPDIELDEGDGAWKSLVYDDKRITQLLPEMLAVEV